MSANFLPTESQLEIRTAKIFASFSATKNTPCLLCNTVQSRSSIVYLVNTNLMLFVALNWHAYILRCNSPAIACTPLCTVHYVSVFLCLIFRAFAFMFLS